MTKEQACISDVGGTTFTVEFKQNFGSLPLLVPDSRLLQYQNFIKKSILTVVKLIDGTKEDVECSNRGICDPAGGFFILFYVDL